jgi:hypothetical protein
MLHMTAYSGFPQSLQATAVLEINHDLCVLHFLLIQHYKMSAVESALSILGGNCL